MTFPRVLLIERSVVSSARRASSRSVVEGVLDLGSVVGVAEGTDLLVVVVVLVEGAFGGAVGEAKSSSTCGSLRLRDSRFATGLS